MSDQDNEGNGMQAPDELTVLKQRAKLMGITHGNNIGVEALKAKINAKLTGEDSTDESDDEAEAGDESGDENETGDGEEQSQGNALDIPPAPAMSPMPTPNAVIAPAASNAPKAMNTVAAADPFASPLGSTTSTNAAVGRPLSKQAAKIAGVVALRSAVKADAMRLVRCRITNLDPKKKDLPGEIIAVGNRYLGTVKKFVPYGEQTENGYHLEKVLFDELSSRQFLHVRSTTDKKTGHIKVETRYVKEFALEVLEPLTAEELHDLAAQQAAANG